jgi:hypothetical protein
MAGSSCEHILRKIVVILQDEGAQNENSEEFVQNKENLQEMMLDNANHRQVLQMKSKELDALEMRINLDEQLLANRNAERASHTDI